MRLFLYGERFVMRLVLFSIMVLALPANAADPFTLKSAKLAIPDAVTEPIRELLDDQAVQFADAKGLVGTFWFRRELKADATATQVKNGLTYRELPMTTVVGVLKLERTWVDFRRQEIEPGVYTMRLAVQPKTGDHDGTAPYTDFCLLVPAAKDEKAAEMALKDLIEMSGESTGSTHPGVVLLFPNYQPSDTPKVVAKDKGIVLLQVKRLVKAGTQQTHLGSAFTIAGVTE